MKILYEDAHILVCIKPAGVLSEGDSSDLKTMPGLLANILAQAGSSHTQVYPVHRLDRETAGIMVYARTQQAAAALSRAVAERKVEKQYLARVHGMPNTPEGEMKDLLYYDRNRNQSFPVGRVRRGVKDASLSYTVVEQDTEQNTTLVRVTLHTGRTHQIRVQFASRGMPLWGDRKYGAPASDGKRLALASVYLAFPHPKDGTVLRFEETLPLE